MGAVQPSRLGATLLGGIAIMIFGGGVAHAHDDITSSDPASGTTIDDPISEVTIDYGEIVADVEMALFDPDDERIEGTTVQISPTSTRLEFAELDDEGVYIVRYLAPVPADGHTLAGAIQFTYGSAGGPSNTVAILLFCGVAIVGLSIGAYFSWRRYRALSSSEVDEDLADVGV